ncbi:MAG: alpha-ribazole phosphatase [Saprospiraceae bacterium]|nr:alpha-ribazole phosphatase [Saprospiraceae bacterium]
MEVHVIRHSPVNFDKNRCYGRLDVPLADSFEEDLRQLQGILDDDYDLIYSSPKTRCSKLAMALGDKNKNIKVDERLLELDFGEWEGKLWSAIDQDELNHWMADFVQVAPSGGESLNQMFARVSIFIDALRNENLAKVLIVTHSGVIRCLWAYLLAIPLENIFKLPVGFHEHFVFKLAKNHSLDAILKLK